MSHLLGNYETVPDFADMTGITKNINKVLKDMQISSTYFEQN